MIDRKLIDIVMDQTYDKVLDDENIETLNNFIANFYVFLDLVEKIEALIATPNTKQSIDFLSRPICDVILNAHAVNPLIKAGYRVMGDVAKKTSQELLEVKGFGEGGLKAVQNVLRENGHELGIKQKKLL